MSAFAERYVLEHLELKPYGWFAASRLESDRNRIAAFFRRNGYAEVSVSEAKTEAAGEGVSKLDGEKDLLMDVSYTLTEGPQFIVGDVKFTGNEKALAGNELLRAVKTQPGALLSDETVVQDGLRLEGLYAERGWHSASVSPIRVRSADPEKLKFAANVWDVTFRVIEGSRKVTLDFVSRDGVRKDGIVLGGPNPDAREDEEPKPAKRLKPLDLKLDLRENSTQRTDDQF